MQRDNRRGEQDYEDSPVDLAHRVILEQGRRFFGGVSAESVREQAASKNRVDKVLLFPLNLYRGSLLQLAVTEEIQRLSVSIRKKGIRWV